MKKYKVKHILKKYDDKSRTLDFYYLYKNCFFPAKVRYLFIGLNPSANNKEFTDKTNLEIINFLFREEDKIKFGSYVLTNLFSNINTNEVDKDYSNNAIEKLISKYKKRKAKIVLFFGRNAYSYIYQTLKRTFNDLISAGLLYMTTDEDYYFTHPSVSLHHIIEVKSLDDLTRKKSNSGLSNP